MHHYRQALLRMRQGDSDRDIAAARVMGRPKAASWRRIASERGWLDAAQPLPDDASIAAALGSPRKASTTISTLEPHRQRLSAWVEQGVSGTAIHAALKRQHGWTGSYSAVRRLVADIRSQLPPETTCRLDFDPGDAAQVDFGAGPEAALEVLSGLNEGDIVLRITVGTLPAGTALQLPTPTAVPGKAPAPATGPASASSPPRP